MAQTKRKKRGRPTPRLRTVNRGMYLELDIATRTGETERVTVDSMQSITSIGHLVSRLVRDYLRHVPIEPWVPSWSLTVHARWVPVKEAARKPAQASEDSRPGVIAVE